MKPDRMATTRVELLAIIVMVIIVPAGLMASLQTARNLSKIPLCANNLRQIGAAVYDYAQIYDGNLPNLLDGRGREEGHFYVAYRGDKPEHFYPGEPIPGGKMMPYRLACLYEAGLIEDARMFYCPAQTQPRFIFDSYNNPQPWGTLPQVYNTETNGNQWVRCGYDWFPIDKNPVLSPHPIGGRPRTPINLCRKFDNIGPNLPYCTDVMRTIEYFSHQYDQVMGLNILYSDGRVVFQDDPNVFSDQRIWSNDPSGRQDLEIMSIYYQRILVLAGQNPWPD